MIEFATTRTGSLCASFGGRLLFSRYDPQMEADRFVRKEIADSVPRTVVIVGAGLGYLCRAVRSHRPRARVIAIYLSRALFVRRVETADEEWTAGDSLALEQFLVRAISDEEGDSIAVLTWEPSARVFEAAATTSMSAVRDILDQNAAGLATEGFFGKRWLHNSVVNTALLSGARSRGMVAPWPAEKVVIAAAGPSLMRSVEAVRFRPDGVQLWALPSAIPVLLDHQCHPDLVVTTDPGIYALEHLKPLRDRPIPIAAPISAALIRTHNSGPVFLLNQGSWFERSLLGAAGLAAIEIAPHGTVAGSAWYLAAALGATSVVFVGLDLCNEDLLSHPKGHSFERILRTTATRNRPYHHILFERNIVATEPVSSGSRARTSRAMRTYAAWFRHAVPPVPTCRSYPSAVELGLPSCQAPWSAASTRSAPRASADPASLPPALLPATGPDTGRCTTAIRQTVDSWISDLAHLETAVARSPRNRDDGQRRVCDIARTLDTAGYLRLVRANFDHRENPTAIADQIRHDAHLFGLQLLRHVEQLG